MEQELFTRKQVAEIFQVTPRSVMIWQKKGKIKASLFVNGRPRYTIEEIQRIVSETQDVNFKPTTYGKSF
jgi:predicted site-specific integrase-resolvase